MRTIVHAGLKRGLFVNLISLDSCNTMYEKKMVRCRVLITALLTVAAAYYSMANSDGRLVQLQSESTLRFYSSSSGNNGILQIKHSSQWNFINGSSWQYNEANVVCRTLGFRAVSAFHSSNVTYRLPSGSGRETPGDKVHGFINIFQCKMRTGSTSECHIEPPVQFTKEETASKTILPVRVENVAWVSCTAHPHGTGTPPPTPNTEAPLQMPPQSDHGASSDWLSITAAVMLSILGAVLVVAVIVIIASPKNCVASHVILSGRKKVPLPNL